MPLSESNGPIYQQIAALLEDQILTDTLQEEEQVYSTNQLSKIYHINPATALKGIGLLEEGGILYKKRGIGMFVSPGAKAKIQAKRSLQFRQEFLQRIISEARKIGIDKQELVELLENGDWEGELS